MSLTHPASAAHSAATASATLNLRLARGSEFRNDRPAEFVIETDSQDRVGAVDGVGQHTVERIVANEPAEIVVAIFELAENVVGDRVGDAAAGGKAAAMNRELVGADAGIDISMTEIAQCPATIEEQQQAVDGDTATGTERGAIPKLGRVDRYDVCVKWCRREELAGIAALDAGPEAIGFDTDHDVAALHVVADLAAGDAAGGVVVDRVIGERESHYVRVVDIVVADAAAAVDADIEAGPVIHWRHDRCGLHREIGGESRQHQTQHAQCDGGEKDTLHC